MAELEKQRLKQRFFCSDGKAYKQYCTIANVVTQYLLILVFGVKPVQICSQTQWTTVGILVVGGGGT